MPLLREQIRAEADFIKVMATGARPSELEDPNPLLMTEAELSAMAGDAHHLRLRVPAWAEGLAGCAAAIAFRWKARTFLLCPIRQ